MEMRSHHRPFYELYQNRYMTLIEYFVQINNMPYIKVRSQKLVIFLF